MRVYLLLIVAISQCLHSPVLGSRLVAFTFGDPSRDSVARQLDSARLHQVDLRAVGPHGSVGAFSELAAMRDYAASVQDPSDTVVLFVERGGLFLNSSAAILGKLRAARARIVLSAIRTCRPDQSLAALYPEVPDTERRFVDASGVLAYADTLLEALAEEALQSISDRQYYFSKLFADAALREKLLVRLDSQSLIFQNLDENFDEVGMEHSADGMGFLVNKLTSAVPCVVQQAGNKLSLDALSNYLGRAWDPVRGCQHCPGPHAPPAGHEQLPRVTLAVFVERATPFLEEFLGRVSSLSYPKSRLALRVSNMVPSHESLTSTFVRTAGPLYSALAYVNSAANQSAAGRRLDAMRSCVSTDCDFLLVLDSLVQLTNAHAIQALVAHNRSVLAPLVSRREQLWSNFWGALSQEGYYARSSDYLDIVNGVRRGVWNVPHVHSVYLVRRDVLGELGDAFALTAGYREDETDLVFSASLRRRDRFMWLANEQHFGHLVDADNATSEHLHNDLWEIFANPLDWRDKYIHENYSALAAEHVPLERIAQPCPDVFWWPLVSETFARHLREEVEFYAQWSDDGDLAARGRRHRNSLTRPLDLREIGWEEHWMRVLLTYVFPLQVKVYRGYWDEPRARLNLVVRHEAATQERAPRHHDVSSYTLHVALSNPGPDYEGGGVRFVRYNCQVGPGQVGWVLAHPGRVTHMHEELAPTRGTKYDLVTFVNP